MEMTIDEARTALGKERKYALHENKQAFDIAMDTMRKYQMFQADYENRLKADLVAMFEELNLEIDEMFPRRIDYTIDKIQDLIQQKINALKEASDA